MRVSKTILLAAIWLTMIGWSGGALSQVSSRDLSGEWATQGYTARVRIMPCAEDAERFCGTITWLWDAVDASGAPLLDVHNPQLKSRQQPLVGLPLLKHFHLDASSARPTWIEGSIYDPESGRTYRSTLTLRSADTLEVQGCVLFVCRTQLWRRVASLCSS